MSAASAAPATISRRTVWVSQWPSTSPGGSVSTSTGRTTKGRARPSLKPDSEEMACLSLAGRLRSATPPATMELATTGSVGVTIAPIITDTQKGNPRIRYASKPPTIHISGITIPRRTKSSRQLPLAQPTGKRSATPTSATPRVMSAASSKIRVWLPRSARSSNPRAAGPISTPASKAIRGSETGVRSLRRPPSIPSSNSNPPTAAKDTYSAFNTRTSFSPRRCPRNIVRYPFIHRIVCKAPPKQGEAGSALANRRMRRASGRGIVLPEASAQGGICMSPSQRTRASGWAAALAGAFFIIAEALTPITLFTNPEALSRVALTDRFVVQSMLTFLAAMLSLAGLVGLYAFQSREAGRLGAIGFPIAFFVTALMLGDFYANTFVTPALAIGVPNALDVHNAGVLLFWLPLEFGFLALAWFPFAVATLRAGVYPRGAAWLLVVGALVALVPLPYVNVPFDAAVAWLGIALMRRSASPSPPRYLRRVRA